MRLLPTFAVAALICTPLWLTGCAGGSGDQSNAAESAPAAKIMAQGVPILGKASGDQLPIQSHGLGILDAEAIAGLGLEEAFANQGFTLDLSKHSVVLFSLGEQPTGGFSADINGLQLKGQQLYVQATAVAPGPDSVVAQALTNPYCAVAVDKLPSGLTVLSDITSLP